MQCGVACIAMICRYYGREYSIEYLDHICEPNREGVSMLAMSKCAERIGLRANTVKALITDLQEVSLPAILHWILINFVVLF